MEGTGRMIMEIIRNGDPSRLEPEVLTLTGNGDLALLSMQAGVPAWNWALKRRFSLSPLRRIQIFLRSGQYDVVHTHGLLADLYARGVANNMRLPVISNVGTAKVDCETRHFLADHWTADGVTAWVSATKEAVNQSAEMRKLPGERIFVIPPGVSDLPVPCEPDLHQFRKRLSIAPDMPVLSMNLPEMPDKLEMDQLLDIVGELIQRIPHLVCLYSCIGERFVKKHPIISDMESSGHLRPFNSADDRLHALNISDVVLVPFTSRGFPDRIIEAMCSGKAIVAADRNDVSEFVEQNIHACLVDMDSSSEVVDAVSGLLSDRRYAALLGSAARERYLGQFSAETMVERYTRIYESCRDKGQVQSDSN